MTRALKSPTRVARGIRSSYELTWPVRYGDEVRFASVREIPVPTVVIVDELTGTLRCKWERVA